VELLSLNDDHKPITLDVNDIEFMHHVAGIAKDVLYHHERGDDEAQARINAVKLAPQLQIFAIS
jgi:hypothetical protein